MFDIDLAEKELCRMLWELQLSSTLKKYLIDKMNKEFYDIYRSNHELPGQIDQIDQIEQFDQSELYEQGIEHVGVVEDDSCIDTVKPIPRRIQFDDKEAVAYLSKMLRSTTFNFLRLLTDPGFAHTQQITRNDREATLNESPLNTPLTAEMNASELNAQTITDTDACAEPITDTDADACAKRITDIEANDAPITKKTSKKSRISSKEVQDIQTQKEYAELKGVKTALHKFFNDNEFNTKQQIGFMLDRYMKNLPYEAYRSNISKEDWDAFVDKIKSSESFISEYATHQTSR